MINLDPVMPVRPHEHVLETLSRRKFELNLDTWVARPIGSDDYGIDLVVEIFRQSAATGDSFAVQLKATRTAGTEPTVRIKRSTLNYWAAQPTPALIALWDEETDTIWYEWAHNLSAPREGAETMTATLSRLWEPSTLQEIDDEVAAFRAAKQLALHTPIDVLIRGEAAVEGFPEAKAELFRTLRGIPKFRTRLADATPPLIQIDIDRREFTITISGRRPERIPSPEDSTRPLGYVPADVIVKLALMLGEAGQLDQVAAELLRRSVRSSDWVLSTDLLPDVVRQLLGAGDVYSIGALIDRTRSAALQPRNALLDGLLNNSRHLDEAQLHQITSHLMRTARPSPAGAQDYLAAARLVATTDGPKSVGLLDRAVALDPSLSDDPVLSLEKGVLLLEAGRFERCVRELETAVAAGISIAVDFVGEALAFQGRYADALLKLEVHAADEPRLPRHALLLRALHHIVDDWGIDEQTRPAVPTDPYAGEDDDSKLAQAEVSIREDALNGWAHWSRCPILASREESTLSTLVAAAVGAPYVPQIWDELIRAAIVADDWDLAAEALWSAREFAEEDFLDMLLTDQFLAESGNQEAMTQLFESLPDVP